MLFLDFDDFLELKEKRVEHICENCKYHYANYHGDPEEKRKRCLICDYETKGQFVPYKGKNDDLKVSEEDCKIMVFAMLRRLKRTATAYCAAHNLDFNKRDTVMEIVCKYFADTVNKVEGKEGKDAGKNNTESD